jgi:predicted phage terminase large subunit-like protein
LAPLERLRKKGSPYSCGVKIGRTRDGKYVVGHVVRARGKPDAIRELILETANFDGKRVRISLPQDPGQAGVWQADSLVKDLAGYSVEATPETGEKVDRARPFAAQVNRGQRHDGCRRLERCLS